jgi:hypothetical protein
MSKFNTKSADKELINDMGTTAYKLSPKEELISTVLTTFVEGSYYEGKDEILERVRKAIEKCDTEFVAKTALYARKDANMRSISHVLAAELARRISGSEWGSRFYKNIAMRPDDMSEILGYYFNVLNTHSDKKRIPNSIKRGFKRKLESMDAYLVDKYKMAKKPISLVDLLNLFHPTPNSKNAEAFKRLVNGESLEGLYTTKILDREMSKAGQTATTAAEKAEAKSEAIRETLETNLDKMPIFNLIRNLRNILESTPDKVDLAVDIITTREKIVNSKMLPFRFASAYAEVEKTSVNSELKKKVLDALEVAINYSCENIPELKGNTAILIDHSGSMRGGGAGASTVSAFSNTTTSVIANLFGCMLMQAQDNVYMGLFGDRLIRVNDIDRSKGILKSHSEIHSKGSGCGGGSEHGLFEFFGDVVKNKVRVDNVIIFSDMVIGSNSWYGRNSASGYGTSSGSFGKLFNDFKMVNPLANVISVDLRQTKGTTIFDKKNGVTNLAGWSDKIFELLGNLDAGYEEIIKHIEAIEL